ncbi:ThiF family adenylyltransferase [Schinkia azotoformans]|uniref:ThiF family adenylyltransferase n=1 Tax=Schinkia azotoformans TaxID=1454 RepID=UPI002DB9439F|nr:ThiF family adenylyltransferase [Schinkia azotoformans]MEC1721347.1 ThiF family adenylyltransferase [Schinkia azotoformans]MED4414494.1 ThiF family adenylyltransferase [Schinkia azotoformans]
MENKYLERYSRQILFSQIGEAGQEKLAKSCVAIVGVGALGTVIANHLTRSGVGFIRIIDRDFVEKTNLQRQMLYDENDALENKPKAVAAYEKLIKINSSIKIEPVVTDIHAWNAEELLSDVDVIIDGTDNFLTRYIINDISIKYSIPWVHGAAVRSRGMFAVFTPTHGPCYRCLFPNPPKGQSETCDMVGVISAVTHLVGSFEATEVIKLIVQDHENRNPNLEQFDIWLNDEMKMDISNSRNPKCPACEKHEFEFLNAAFQGDDYAALCGRNAVQITPRKEHKVDLEKMKEILLNVGTVELNPFLLKCHLDEITIILFNNGRVMIQGTDDITKAKAIYAKYIGS